MVASGILRPLYAQQDRSLPALKVSGVYTVTGTKTFDQSAAIEVAPGGKFVKGANGRLIFKRQPKAARRPIFEGFSAGDVVFEAACVVWPEWWGASATGDPATATANVAAINAALAAVANSGGAVRLDGLYYIDNPIRPRSHSQLSGAGRGIIKAVSHLPLWKLPPLGRYLIEIDGQSAITIDGIELDGNQTGQVQDSQHAYGGIILVRSSRCGITNCKIHDCNGQTTGGAIGNGIRTNAATDIVISKNQLYSNNGCGINVYFSSKRICVTDNTIWNNTEIGIESEGRRGVDYTNHRNTAITIAGNRISGKTDARRVDDHSILVDWTDNAAVVGNECKNNNHNGIEILGCRGVTVAGNRCTKNGDVGPPRTWAGIRVTAECFGENGRSQDVTICDNQIAGSQHGIYVDTADRVLITANKVTETVHDALKIGLGTADVSVSGNDLGLPKKFVTV
jgi:parallel beta-helix repeat protein